METKARVSPVKSRKTAKSSDGLISTVEAADLLMISDVRVRQFIKEGVIERRGRGQVDRRNAVQGYIRFLKDDARRSSKSAASSRVQDARAREIELKIAERDKRLIDLVEVRDLFAFTMGSIKAGLAGLPSRVTRDQALKRTVELEVNDILRKVADQFEEGAAHLAGGAKGDDE